MEQLTDWFKIGKGVRQSCILSPFLFNLYVEASQEALVVKNLPASAGDIRDVGSVPESGRSPGGGHGNPLCSSLENPMVGGAWWATVHGVAQNGT